MLYNTAYKETDKGIDSPLIIQGTSELNFILNYSNPNIYA